MEEQVRANRSLLDLEWPELCQAVASFAHSDLAREQALDLSPADCQETAEVRLEVLKDALELHSQGAMIPARMVRDCEGVSERLRLGSLASAEELHRLLQMLRLAGDLDRFGGTHESTAPTLGRVLAVSQDLGPLCRRLNEVIDDNAEVRDDASVGLQRARAALASLRRQIQKRLEELIKRYREALQDGFYAERDGRYVLPVRVDAPFRVEGTVLDTSSSASTLYVEPREIAELGNKLRMAELEVHKEVALILAELSAELSPHTDELLWAQGVCVRADLIFACVKFSVATSARVIPFGKPGRMRLSQARHPLLCLALDKVVPNDMGLQSGEALILSGPNAGGKTVALKTLGLMALMQATGLPIPAGAESEVGFFDEVLSDIGDDQSLSMSLSSFSGHVERVRNILDEAGHGSLVLFDELMGGTDPNEGAALAIATINGLVSAGAAVCVTTHYEALKEHASTNKNFENAAVGFDFARMEPTFTVETGRPGASSALIVAERHGLPKWVTQHAERLLPEVISEARRYRIEVEGQSLLLQQERKALADAREEQERLNLRLQREADKLKEARLKDLGRESDELRREVMNARSQLRAITRKLKSATPEQFSEIDAEIARASSVVALGSLAEKEVRAAKSQSSGLAVKAAQLKVGDKVKVRGFSSSAEVLELPRKGKVLVLAGVMKMSVPLGELVEDGSAIAREKAKKAGQNRKKGTALSRLEPQVQKGVPVRSEETTLDLRGRRVEESLLLVDQFIDELLRRQEMGAFILHGHGTGALKEAVRQHLRAHPCIQSSRPAERDEGGDAFSIIWLPS